jgi:hypothetical protein
MSPKKNKRSIVKRLTRRLGIQFAKNKFVSIKKIKQVLTKLIKKNLRIT